MDLRTKSDIKAPSSNIDSSALVKAPKLAQHRGEAVQEADVVRADDPVVAALGERVKLLRSRAGLTLEDLAAQSKVSRAMISNVERGEKSPTLAIIVRIARGLGVSLSELLGAAPETADVSVIKSEKRLSFTDPETGFQRQILSPTHLDNGIEFLFHKIPPKKSSGILSTYKNPTEKYLVVHEGSLVVSIDKQRYVLNAGDSFYFEIKAPYRFTNEGDEPCAYYLVIVRKR